MTSISYLPTAFTTLFFLAASLLLGYIHQYLWPPATAQTGRMTPLVNSIAGAAPALMWVSSGERYRRVRRAWSGMAATTTR